MPMAIWSTRSVISSITDVRNSEIDAARDEVKINIFCFVFTDKILATLGEGTFGRVVKVKDLER